jgi:replication factor A1
MCLLNFVSPCQFFTKIVLSDGEHYCNGMLATQLNHFVHSGQIQENTLIQISDYMNNTVQGRVVIIVLNLMVVLANHPERIGSPIDIGKTTIGQITSDSHATNSNNTTQTITTQPIYSRTHPTDTASSKTASIMPPSSSVNPYGGSKPAMMVPSAPIVRSTATMGVPLTPISQLNMYQNRWTIQARVTSKSDIRSWSNARGEGTLFSVELLDSSAVDVKATFFKEAVDKFYGMLEVNNVYTFSGGRLKVANTQYNSCKCPYEITFDQNSEIHKVNDTGDIQSQRYDFVSIASLETADAGTTVDILVYIKSVGEPTTLISKKTGQELIKCDLTVFDQSATEICLTVWGDQARQAPSLYGTPSQSVGPVMVAFRRVRISDYGGKTLSTTTNGAATRISSPLSLPEANALQQWWQQQQRNGAATIRSLSTNSAAGGNAAANISLLDRKDIRAIQMEQLGLDPEKADWISLAGTVTFLKKDKEGGAWYPACANAGEPCKNRFKATQTTDNNWFCDKCQGTYPNCVRRWIFSATISDDTSTTWVSFFNEQAEILLGGVTADQVYSQVFMDPSFGGGGSIQQQDVYDSYFAKVMNTDWIFKCKVKQEMMGDEARVKTSVHSLHPIHYAKECMDLLDAIAKF